MSDSDNLVARCKDERVQAWFRDADEAGWLGLDEIAENAMRVHGQLDGFWRCGCCDSPVIDPAIDVDCSPESIAVQLIGDAILCTECYDAAQEARKKIVMHWLDEGWEEDRGALSDEESELAGWLDAAEAAENRQARELISSYPANERRQLHRYADQNEIDRLLSGKTIEPPQD